MVSVPRPTIDIAGDLGTPARSRLRTTIRRKSWNRRPGRPEVGPARLEATRKLWLDRPLRWNIHGITLPVRLCWTNSATGKGLWLKG